MLYRPTYLPCFTLLSWIRVGKGKKDCKTLNTVFFVSDNPNDLSTYVTETVKRKSTAGKLNAGRMHPKLQAHLACSFSSVFFLTWYLL
jgi:hypothetical protein